MMDEFLRMAKANTSKNLETCGVLAGIFVSIIVHLYSCQVVVVFTFSSLMDIGLTNLLAVCIFLTVTVILVMIILQKKGTFYVSTLIIPKQEATSDSVSDTF